MDSATPYQSPSPACAWTFFTCAETGSKFWRPGPGPRSRSKDLRPISTADRSETVVETDIPAVD